MAGMVFQWCSDYYLADYWKYAPQSDPPGPTTGKERVVKSGSWYDDDDVDFVAARRTNYPAKAEYILTGFRCAAKP
jgi:formylglycine-generating enzyme required for sulfatase activity